MAARGPKPEPIARRAVVGICRDCGADVVRGLDADMCAWDVVADVTPVSDMGRALAIITGRRLLILDVREHLHVVDSRHAMKRTERLIPEHRCSMPLPIDETWSPKPAAADLPTEPPF